MRIYLCWLDWDEVAWKAETRHLAKRSGGERAPKYGTTRRCPTVPGIRTLTAKSKIGQHGASVLANLGVAYYMYR